MAIVQHLVLLLAARRRRVSCPDLRPDWESLQGGAV